MALTKSTKIFCRIRTMDSCSIGKNTLETTIVTCSNLVELQLLWRIRFGGS